MARARKAKPKKAITSKEAKKARATAVPAIIVREEAQEAPKRGRGKQTTFDREIAAEICRRLSEGETLRQICRDDRLPSESTVRSWVLDDREGFSAQYARARDMCMECWADEIMDIADNGTNDWVTREMKGGRVAIVLNDEAVQRSRLRADSRKWLLSKLKPERYGDKLTLGGELNFRMTDDQLDSRLASLTAKAGEDAEHRVH